MDETTNEEWEPRGTDGWAIDQYAPTVGVGETMKALVHRPRHRELTEEELASRARAMALFCHMSVLFGLPVFLIPMVTRDDPFVLHHAKAAAVIFTIFYGALVSAIVVSPLIFAGVVFAYLPGLIAVHHAAGGEKAGLLGMGWAGELLLFPIQTKRERALLEGERAPKLLDG